MLQTQRRLVDKARDQTHLNVLLADEAAAWLAALLNLLLNHGHSLGVHCLLALALHGNKMAGGGAQAKACESWFP